MLAIRSEIKKPTAFSRFFCSVSNRFSLQRWVAAVFTLTMHLLVLWIIVFGHQLSPQRELLVEHLHYIELPPQQEPISARALKPFVINSAFVPVYLPEDNLPVLPELMLQEQPLTARELQDMLGNDVLPLEKSADIARNVFHPGLRKQLTDEANKPVLARAEDRGLETYIDPSGATIVAFGNGSCMRSPAVKIGEPKNWYITSCVGKSESEKIMDRVNSAVNGNKKSP